MFPKEHSGNLGTGNRDVWGSRGRELARKRGPGVPFPNWMGRSGRGRLVFAGRTWGLPIDLALPLLAPRNPSAAWLTGAGATEGRRPLKPSAMDRTEKQHPFYRSKFTAALMDWWIDCAYSVETSWDPRPTVPSSYPLFFSAPREGDFWKVSAFLFKIPLSLLPGLWWSLCFSSLYLAVAFSPFSQLLARSASWLVPFMNEKVMAKPRPHLAKLRSVNSSDYAASYFFFGA